MIENSSYYTISNVAKKLNIPPHVLRFWEKKFNFLKPKKSQTCRRYYSNQDIVNLEIIQDLLHNKGYTITGAIRYIKNNNQSEDNKLDQLNINNESLVKKILLIPFFLFKDLNRIYSSLIDSFLGIFSHPFSQLPLLNKSLKVIFKLMSQSTTETIK